MKLTKEEQKCLNLIGNYLLKQIKHVKKVREDLRKKYPELFEEVQDEKDKS